MRTNKRVGAIIVRDNKYLLIHRRKNGDEYWVVVGGGVEDEDESVERGLAREVKEETGLELLSCQLLMVDTDREGVEHHFFWCEVGEGEPELGGPELEANCEENSYQLEWVDKEMAKELEDVYPRAFKDLVVKIF